MAKGVAGIEVLEKQVNEAEKQRDYWTDRVDTLSQRLVEARLNAEKNVNDLSSLLSRERIVREYGVNWDTALVQITVESRAALGTVALAFGNPASVGEATRVKISQVVGRLYPISDKSYLKAARLFPATFF